MKWVFYRSLNSGAKKAFNRGTGKYRKYVVDRKCIATLDEHGRPKDWVLVVKGVGPTITERR